VVSGRRRRLRQNGAEWGRETGAATQFPVISYTMMRGMKAAKKLLGRLAGRENLRITKV
jgi:hypothetical protein